MFDKPTKTFFRRYALDQTGLSAYFLPNTNFMTQFSTNKTFFTLLFVCFITLGSLPIFAQANTQTQTSIIAKFSSHKKMLFWKKQLDNPSISFQKIISDSYNLAQLGYNQKVASLEQVKAYFSNDVLWISPNKAQLSYRALPNDTLFNSQWAHPDINTPDMWDHTTGGLTQNGDTIVIAILENGTSLDHPDLAPNFYHNYAEIPNDSLDNDQNGYIDDYTGWNFSLESGQHPYNSHSTKVTGIIGAKGNNIQGVSGVNWDIKLLPITINASDFGTVFSAFEYLIALRKKYNDSHGAEGAFVVAVNESFGQDNAHPNDNPNHQQWCEYIDALGEVGILTIGATTNKTSYNVDLVGDMPTTCPQNYLVAVTSIDQLGNRYGGFGPLNIDLAAPGGNILTTSGLSSYGSFGGTSAATPHVSGAIGLIYSYPSEKWNNFIQSNPADAALLAKEWILEGTKPLESLDGKILTGGSLNFLKIIEQIEEFGQDNKMGPLSLKIKPSLVNESIEVSFKGQFGEIQVIILNALGQPVYSQNWDYSATSSPTQILNLSYLPQGLYWISMRQGNDVISQKFIKL